MLYLITAVLLCFGLVIIFGAPYLPTLKKQSDVAFELLNLKPGQTLLELGSGDGRVLKQAAQKGYNAVGYELNPVLVLISYIYCFKYRQKIKIIWGNYWQKDWPEADGIFVFLLDKYMKKLDTKVTQQYNRKNVKLVSYTFKVPGKKIIKSKGALFLYKY